MEDRYLNEKEVSKITGISVVTLQQHRFKKKGIPFIKLERLVKYKYSDVIEYMESKRIDIKE